MIRPCITTTVPLDELLRMEYLCRRVCGPDRATGPFADIREVNLFFSRYRAGMVTMEHVTGQIRGEDFHQATDRELGHLKEETEDDRRKWFGLLAKDCQRTPPIVHVLQAAVRRMRRILGLHEAVSAVGSKGAAV